MVLAVTLFNSGSQIQDRRFTCGLVETLRVGPTLRLNITNAQVSHYEFRWNYVALSYMLSRELIARFP